MTKMLAVWFILFLNSFLTSLSKVHAFAVSTAPDNGVFLLQRHNRPTSEGNVSHSDIYVHNGCFANSEQLLTANIGEQNFHLPLNPSAQNLHCAVALKIIDEKVSIERPFVDIVVYRDHAWTNTFKQKLCITAQLQNSNFKSITGSCSFSENDAFLNACLIRQEIPFAWFHLNGNHDHHYANHVKVSYSVGTYCTAPHIPLKNQRVTLLADMTKFQSHSLSLGPERHFSLLARPNLTFVSDSMAPLFVHFRTSADDELTNATTSRLRRIELKVWMDSRLELQSATSLAPDSWKLRVASTAPPSFHTSFALQPQRGYRKMKQMPVDGAYLLAMIFRVKQQPENGVLAGISENKHISLHWSLQYFYDDNIVTNESRLVTEFSLGLDEAYGIAAVSRDYDIINTAAISGTQTATPMHIYSVSEAGQLRDVTDKAHCISSEPRLLKTSPTCTSVYVDGSEVRGSNGIEVHVQYRLLSSKAIFTVWYPKLPITVWVSDPVLNAISDWHVAVWKDLPHRRRRAQEARQFACKPRYQRTEIRVLAAFHVVDEETGERTFLTGSKELMFDVTQISASRIQSEDPSILVVQKKGPKLIGVPKRPGVTRLVIKTIAPAIDYGSISIAVSDDRVSPTQIVIWPVADVQLQLLPQANNPLQYELATQIQSVFTHQYQHGTIEAYIFYSDAQRELLSDVDTKEYSLSVFSSDDQVLRLTQQRGPPTVELIALRNADEIMLTVEVHSPTFCEEDEAPPVCSGQTGVQIMMNGGHFDGTENNDGVYAQNGKQQYEENNDGHFDFQPLLVILLTLLLIICLFHLVTGHYRSLHHGYEKLVVPLLARFSSNASITSDKDVEDIREWVWMPKEQLDSRSIGSRYSQRSTLEMGDKSLSRGSSSGDDNTHKSVSVSYRGSEISVFIAPQPAIAVHNDGMVSTALSLEDSPIPEPRNHHHYYSTSLLRPEQRQERRVSENCVYMRPHNNYPIEPCYQSIGHARGHRIIESSQRPITASIGSYGIKRPRITCPEYYGMRESIA